MTEKKQGRRSAKHTQQTKKQILTAAARLFCQYGYKKVSLRQISEQSRVSHSLLRYHFGSKELIWQQISDAIYLHYQQYIERLNNSIAIDLPANIRLYQIVIRVLAFSLYDSRASQFLADAIRQDKKMLEYFLDPFSRTNQLLELNIHDFKQSYPDSEVSLASMRWQVTFYAHAASSLYPMLESAFPCQQKNALLLHHWHSFNLAMIQQLHVPANAIESPTSIEELILAPAD